MECSVLRRILGKVSFWVIAVVCTGIIVIAFDIRVRLHRFHVEDRIHQSFLPVVMAIKEYREANGKVPATLGDLVPNLIDRIPQSCYVDEVRYKVLQGGTEWELAIHSTALRQERTYYCRSNDDYTDAEQARTVLQYHGIWRVLQGESQGLTLKRDFR